jgi:hypothetical protein
LCTEGARNALENFYKYSLRLDELDRAHSSSTAIVTSPLLLLLFLFVVAADGAAAAVVITRTI